MSDVFVLRTDGGARGNPGPAGSAFVLEDAAGRVVRSGGRYLGETTNNVAEYEALIWGLETALDEGIAAIDVRCDSELVVRQVCGQYRVRNEGLVPLHARVVELLARFPRAKVKHVRRAENKAADELANRAMDLRETFGDGAERLEAVQGSLFEKPVATRIAEPKAAAVTHREAASRVTDRQAKGGGVYELTVKDHFDAAHALAGYPGECRGLHGHTWDVEVTVAGEHLDEIGIVYDFKQLKADLAAVLSDYDHVLLSDIPPFDTMNSTAENLARVVFERLSESVGKAVRVTEVAVWESPIARLVYRP